MKKFIKSVVLFFIPIMTLSFLGEFLLRQIPNDYALKKDYLDKNSNEIEVLFLGSSHVFYGVNPAISTFKSFNASHPSQSLEYDFELLKKYEKQWAKLKCVVIPIDYFSLFSTLETSEEAWRVKNYTIYYDIHTTQNVNDYMELLSNKLKINLGRLQSHYFKHENNISCTHLGWGFNYHSENKKDLNETGLSAAKRHSIKTNTYCAENKKVLRSLLNYAQIHDIKVVMFTSPAYHTYVENLDSVQLNYTINTVSELDKLYKNAHYFNLLSDKNYTQLDYYDADHLNEIGAQKLTHQLDSIIHLTCFQTQLSSK